MFVVSVCLAFTKRGTVVHGPKDIIPEIFCSDAILPT